MKRRTSILAQLALVALPAAALSVAGCALLVNSLVPPAEDMALGAAAYDDATSEAPLVTSGAKYQMVQRCMQRLVAALGPEDPGFDWEVRLIQADDTVNAFCLPGGKMAVYTGILPVAQDEEGLAVVMGHEIAHATRRHGMQRVIGAYGTEGVLNAIEAYVSPEAASYRELTQGVIELAVAKPYGRDNELEADYDGLILMARAGYDPRAAPAFWQRMAALGSSSTPEFLSTHPSHDRRIEELEEAMATALAIYKDR